MKLARSLLLWTLLLAALAPPGVAAAETRTYLSTEGFGPALEAGGFGPATNFPGAVEVSGVAGTVTDVNLTAIELSADANLDMALVGPNGAEVMLMSDVCKTTSAAREIWTFDDEAPELVPQVSCPPGERKGRRPTNNEPQSDDFALFGGPEGPFTESLSAFDGISPNGAWELFMIDDTEGGVGFEMSAFALELEMEPPAPQPPAVRTVLVPGPTITVTAPPAATVTGKTGKRAAALAKCKAKKTAKARARCKAKARQLPI